MLGSKYLIVKDGTCQECSEDREEQSQPTACYTGPLGHTQWAMFQSLLYGIWSNDSALFSSFNFSGPCDYQECQGKRQSAGLSPVFSPSLCAYLLMLLLSHFSHVWLCVIPQTAAHQAPPSLGFSRQEHWSGLPLPSPMCESEKWKWSHSVVSDS